MHGLENIYIVTKTGLSSAQSLGQKIRRWLEAKGVASWVVEASEARHCLQLKGIQSAGLLLVLGGDGTILSLARRIKAPIPLLGINFGRVGFLTELTVENWQNGLEQILSGAWEKVSYLALHYGLLREGRVIREGRAINDVVISRGGKARLIDLSVQVDEEQLGLLRGDGLVVSTPLGSTAYALAAGGALVMPGLEVMELCPICPFLKQVPPLVLPGEIHLQVTLSPMDGDAFLTVDGQSGDQLQPLDIVHVSRAGEPVVFAKLSTKQDYFEKLSQKGYL